MDTMEDIRKMAQECGDGIDSLKARVEEWEIVGLDVIEASLSGDSIATRRAVGRMVDLMRSARLPRKASAIPVNEPVTDTELVAVFQIQQRLDELEAVRESLVAERNEWRAKAEAAENDMGRMRADFEERLREVEIHGARRIGGVLNEPAQRNITDEEMRAITDEAMRSIHEAAAPIPDQNHTGTIPAPEKPKRHLSPETRERLAENMRRMRAAQTAEKGLSAAQLAAKRVIKDRVWRAVPLPLDTEFLRHTMAMHGLTRAELVAAVLTFTPGDMERTPDAAEFYLACQEEAQRGQEAA